MKAPCKHPGCPEILSKHGYCAKHEANRPDPRKDYEQRRRRDPALARAQDIRSSGRWAKVRRIKMALNPVCEDPFGKHGTNTRTAAHAHHIKPVVRCSIEECFDLANLMSLCVPCHIKLEAETDRG